MKLALYILLILCLPVILLVALAMGLAGVGRVPYE